MVKTKHQKSKPKPAVKSSHVKKPGKPSGKPNDVAELRSHLDTLGLKIIQVTADGNCFFRSLADQLEGNEEQHEKYRHIVVQYIMANREMFEPFIEDEVPFEDYCKSMNEDGTWAGHMELQAASLATHCNICIHRRLSPRWYIRNFENHEVTMIHLSYHDGEHYNSVRSKDDSLAGPARPIIIKADADLSETSQKAKTAVPKSKVKAGGNTTEPGSVKMVMDGTGCTDVEKVKQVLEAVEGDVDTAIEYIIAVNNEDPISENVDDTNSNWDPDQWDKEEAELQKAIAESSMNGNQRSQPEKSKPSDDKIIPRNKTCPCGSKKKYKGCCGSVSGKYVARLAINKAVDDATDRKDRKNRKKTLQKAPNHNQPSAAGGQQPDLGALCI